MAADPPRSESPESGGPDPAIAAAPGRGPEGRGRRGGAAGRASPRTLAEVPRDPAPDASAALLREGYRFIPNRCARMRTDVFRTRLMLRDALCMQGPEAAALLYGTPGMTRAGAMPQTVLRLLQDKGSVQQLDGAAHRHRKAMFLSILLDEGRIDALAAAFREAWRDRLGLWEARGDIALLPEANAVLVQAAVRWCGLPLTPAEAEKIAPVIFEMIDGTGGLLRAGPALLRRRRLEARLRALIRDARAQPRDLAAAPAEPAGPNAPGEAGEPGGPHAPSETGGPHAPGETGAPHAPGDTGDPHAPGWPGGETPLHVLAWHRDASGARLTEEVAAVELMNLLRPLAAVSRFIAFAALTLHRLPEWRARFAAGSDRDLPDFAEELRRISPFFPFAAAIVRDPLRWRDMELPAGQWVLFDLYGTCQDPGLFPAPERFRPERMLSWRDEDPGFVPQGGGPVATTHRCPGEMATVRLISEAVRLLCREMRYAVPPQDLSVRLSRVPAQPASGMILSQVRRA